MAELVDAADLNNLSASVEMQRVEGVKNGETLMLYNTGNTVPSF